MSNPHNASIHLTSTVVNCVPMRWGVLAGVLKVPATPAASEALARCRDIESAARCLDHAVVDEVVVDELGRSTTVDALSSEVSRRLAALRESLQRTGIMDGLDSTAKAAVSSALSAVAAEL